MTDQDNVKKYVTFYYADWCGHCKTFKPEWFKLKSAYNKVKKDIINKYKVELILNEYDDTSQDEISKAGIEGFPTIKIKYNDKIDDYIGARTAIALFKKLIPQASDDEIINWLDKAVDGEILKGEMNLDKEGKKETGSSLPSLHLGGSNGLKYYGIEATDPKIIFANSYRKYLKYKKKCDNIGITQ